MNYGLIYLIKWPVLVEIIGIFICPSIYLFLTEFLTVWIGTALTRVLSVLCVHSTIIPCQTSFLCILNAVCIWLDAKCDEWGCVWVNEWIIYCFTMWWMWCMNDCVIGVDYFSISTIWLIHFNCSILAFYLTVEKSKLGMKLKMCILNILH